MEVDPIAIIQIDATVITGILILLTITKFVRTTEEFWLPKAVSSIVIPFAISALLAIWQLLKDFSTTPEGDFIPASLLAMALVFATNPNPFHAKMTEIEAFTRYRDRVGLTGKYESTNRHHITLHSFRSYFFTRARRVHDTDIAHAMVGHSTYLDMYDRKDDEEKLELYLRVESELRIS